MNITNVCFKKSILAVVAVLSCATVAQAANGSWNGSSDAMWTNSANWSSAPYPSGTDTATFSNASPNVTLDIANLVSVLNITFDTANAAAYSIGAGAANSQTLIMGDNGTFRMTGGVAAGQTFKSAVQLGPNTTSASYTFQNDATGLTQTLNNVSGTTGGTKTINFNGIGPISLLGNLDKKASGFNVNLNTTGALNLSGANNYLTLLQINGAGSVINLAAGTTMYVSNAGGSGIMAGQNCTINGPGVLSLSTAGGDNHLDNGVETGKTLTINAKLTGATGFEFWHGTYCGTIVLNGTNDYTMSTIINVPGTISVSVLNNKGVAGNLGTGTTFIHNGANARLLYTGAGETTDRTIQMNQDGIIEQGGTGNLNFSSPITVSSGTKTLTLQGSTAGTGEFSGAIRNDAGGINLKKEGTGTWTLSANSTYTGTTVINGGRITLSGSAGAISGSSSITLAANTELKLSNTAAANNTDRLGNAISLTLNGATLNFTNDAGAANFSETVGALTLVQGANTIAVAPAASGQTSTLQLGAFNHVAGTINFTGAGLGTNSQNRIFITGQPDGLIGPWATINGASYAGYSSAQGVYAAATSVTNIAARGPDSVIPDDATADVHITTAGVTNDITLAGATTDSIFNLQQDTTTDATVATAGKTLKATQVGITSGQKNLTLGDAQGDGTLASLNAGGNLTLANNDGTSVLTVNAAIANNTSASSLSKAGTGKVLLTGPLTYTGTTGLGGGTLSFGGSLTQTLASVISGPGNLMKEGSGQLTLSGANSYTGLTTISSGTLLAQNSAALGTAAGGTLIQNGATLDLGGTLAAQALNLGDEVITVSGSGVNGRGAIVNNSNTSQYNALRNVVLAGDATFGGDPANGRWDLRSTGGAPSLLMNGYTITKVGANQFGLTGVPVTPGTGNVNIVQGSMTLEVGATLGGSSNNVMTVQGDAYFDLYQISTPIVWRLVMNDNARLYTRSGNVTNWNIWAGPVTLNGGAFFDGAGTTMDTVSGNITGSGSAVKIGAGSVTCFTGTNNTYSGNTIASNGVLYAKYPGSLPGYNAGGKVIVAPGGTVTVPVSNGSYGWTGDQIRDLHNTNLFVAADASLGIETAGNFDYLYNFPVPMGVTKQGNGTLNIPDGQSLISQIKVNGGELVLDNMTVNTTNVACYVGDAAADYGKLTVSNAVWYSIRPAASTFCPLLAIGNSGKGVLVVQGNTALTNRFNLGQNGGSHGAVYQQDGNVVNWGGPSYDGRIGLNGYGYYELNGGALSFKGWSQLGGGLSGVGIMKVSGGAFTQTADFGGSLGVSRGGTGVVYVTAGNFNTLQEFWVGDPNDNGTSGGLADFTMAGGKATISGSVKMADRNNMKSVVNLNGGVLEANQIYRAVRTGSQVTVGFSGGTFRARTGGALFGTGTAAPDSVSIYAGGAIFDTTNFEVSVSVPLLAPTGSGISSIPITASTGFMGPPFVTLSGGGGTGATAIAQFNSANGTVSGVLITCPGFGYTSNPVATFSGGGTNFIPAVSTLIVRTANTSGGLTKLGSSLLLLNATNTYAGATSISNGTLRLGVAAALPANGAINISGGMLDLGSFSVTAGVINASAGSIINGNLYGSGVTKVQSGTLTLGTQLTSPAPIVIGEGTLRLQGLQPGLNEAPVTGAFNTTEPMSTSIVTRLTTRMANIVYTEPYNTTWIYSGYLWNRATTNVTWTFAENFDDSVLLKIDGNTVLNNGTWNAPTTGNYTLTPGAHVFESRFGQGTGGGGPVNSSWWTTTTIGFGIDYLGRSDTNIANYVALTDPGDGSLLTLTAASSSSNMIATASTVDIAAGATLDLGGMSQTLANLRGSGIISNGTVGVTGTVAPGGTNVIGTLTLAASSALTGTLLVDVATDGTSDRLAVQGNVNLSALNLVIANPGQLNRTKQYTLVTCTGTRTGAFASVTGPDSRWHVVYQADGTAKLVNANGMLMRLF